MSDLTVQEQGNVRAALRFFRAKLGGWGSLIRALHTKAFVLGRLSKGDSVSASMAIRVARLAGVGVDDLLAGHFPPPGTCPYCGHQNEAA